MCVFVNMYLRIYTYLYMMQKILTKMKRCSVVQCVKTISG